MLSSICRGSRLAVALFLGCVLAAMWNATAGEQPARVTFTGFRGDGTGLFPADCTPVTTWNEWDFKEAKEGQRPRLEPDKENRRNIVWKVPLNNFCNGGMVVAGGKLFQMVDRGGNGYATDVVPDFVGPLLVCMDPKDGKILWKQELEHLDTLPAEEAKQARQDILDYYTRYVAIYGPYFRWHEAAGMRWNPIKTPEQQEAYKKAAAAWAEALRKVSEAAPAAKALSPVPLTAEELAKCDVWRGTAGTYTQCAYWGLEERYFRNLYEKRKRVVQLGYPFGRFFGEGSWIGEAMPTPLSDGKRLWVNTGYNDVFCLDLDGRRLWSRYFGPVGGLAEGPVTSSILAGDLLVIRGFTGKPRPSWCFIALDKNTGKVVWVHKVAKPGSGGGGGTPLLLTLPVAQTGKNLDVIWTHNGDVLRVRDGKLLADEVGHHGNYRTAAALDDLIVLSNGSAEGGHGSPTTFPAGTVAVRLRAESEERVLAEQVWHKPPLARASLVIHEGLVYFDAGGKVFAVNVKTGEEVGKMERPGVLPNHVWAIAGNYLFGLNADGKCLVATLGKDMKPVAVNRLGDKTYCTKGSCYIDFFNEGAQPFFSGNRIFIRSYTDVYCIGNPQEPMRLSPGHQ